MHRVKVMHAEARVAHWVRKPLSAESHEEDVDKEPCGGSGERVHAARRAAVA